MIARVSPITYNVMIPCLFLEEVCSCGANACIRKDVTVSLRCADGWNSLSIGERGACFNHGGVVRH